MIFQASIKTPRLLHYRSTRATQEHSVGPRTILTILPEECNSIVTALIERSINSLGEGDEDGWVPPVAERRHEALNSHFRVARKVMFEH